MLFQSGAFLIFFPIVILLFYLIPQKGQMPFLLAASYYFYMSWNAKYALLLLFSTVLTYSCARLIEKAESAKSRKVFLILCLVLQLGILFGMKYLNFAVSLLARLLLLLHVELTVPAFDIVLPVGISFYTFLCDRCLQERRACGEKFPAVCLVCQLFSDDPFRPY